MLEQNKVTGVILAGGMSRRMHQQDKGILLFRGRAMICYAIDALTETVDEILISANRNEEAYVRFGYPVVRDEKQNFAGPLAGILAAMEHASSEILLVIPCDSPFIKSRHLKKLLQQHNLTDADIAVPFDGERLHCVFLVLRRSLKDSLRHYLQQGECKVENWLEQHKMTRVDFSDDIAALQNINTPEDLKNWQN